MITGNSLLASASILTPVVPEGTRSNVFNEIYTVFLVLGTVVGVVVIAYMLHKAYKYRASAGAEADAIDRPELGELPEGSGGGRKLFVSFTLSAIIVISLITWTYFTLLYVEDPDTADPEDTMEVEVVAHQFYWEFVYPNGHSERGTLRVPEDTRINLRVTSGDVFHNFGVPELRAKADAIPGQTTTTWFMAKETGRYTANCYELCGNGHSYMDGTVVVMEAGEFQNWYASTNNSTSGSAAERAGLPGVAAGV
jgi:cytochrome c oxidase subunit 2